MLKYAAQNRTTTASGQCTDDLLKTKQELNTKQKMEVKV